ncbi:MAG: hypothetical protein GY925_04300 [Actinomycetia bacterium]|nr:hypothetical protein [Actinomycetes bacterium]
MVGASVRTTTARVITACVVILFVASGCELNDRVDERMREPDITDRFLSVEVDETSTVVDDEVVDGSDVDGVIDESDDRADQMADLERAADDPALIVEGWWSTGEQIPGGEVAIRADISLDLVELTDTQIADLDLVDETQEDTSQLTKWYRVDGSIDFDLIASSCEPTGQVDDCRLVNATHGSVTGFATRDGDGLVLVLDWLGLGRGGAQLALPLLEVEVIDARGFTTMRSSTVLGDSIGTRLIDSRVPLTIGDPDKLFRSSNPVGEGELLAR